MEMRIRQFADTDPDRILVISLPAFTPWNEFF